jgi:hypothetical protein
MLYYGKIARDAYAAYARATAKPRADALRALEMKQEHVAASFRPVALERRQAFDRLKSEIAKLHKSAVEVMHLSEPAAVDRSLVMAKPERQQAAAAARQLLESASLAELAQVAKDAAQRRDPATAYAVRATLASRPDVKPEEAGPILDTLAAPHAEKYEDTVRDLLAVQIVGHQVETGGPMALPLAATMLANTKALASYYAALNVETPTGKRTFREHEVLELLPREALVAPQEAAPDGDFRDLLSAVTQAENEEIMLGRTGMAPTEPAATPASFG